MSLRALRLGWPRAAPALPAWLTAAPASRTGPALSLVGAAVWVITLQRASPSRFTDVGLVSALPVSSYVALAVVVLGVLAGLAVRTPARRSMVVSLAALCVCLFGAAALVEDVPRLEATYRHAGIADHIQTVGQLDLNFDAYFNWPGFFAATAMVADLAGLDHPIELAHWASVAFNLAYMAPLLVLAGAFTRDERLRWTGVLVFYLANWVGQDYFAPQAFGFLLYLTAIALVVRYLPGRRAGLTDPSSTPVQRAAVAAAVALAAATVAFSHQLTPFALIGALAALAVFGRRSPGLVVLVATITGAWLLFGASTYLQGHLGALQGLFGNVFDSLDSNIGQRMQGSEGHLLVIRTRMLSAAALVGLAVLGALRHWRRGKREWELGALALAPVALFAGHPYGGEMVLRIYFFSAPFLALLAASALVPRGDLGLRPLRAIATVGTVVAFMAASLLIRYGNEKGESFTAAEREGVAALYQRAPRGSTVIAGTNNLPWKLQDYTEYEYRQVVTARPNERGRAPRVDDVLELVANTRGHDVFVILTRSQHEQVELFHMIPAGSLAGFERALQSSGITELVFRNADTNVYQVRKDRLP